MLCVITRMFLGNTYLQLQTGRSNMRTSLNLLKAICMYLAGLLRALLSLLKTLFLNPACTALEIPKRPVVYTVLV